MDFLWPEFDFIVWTSDEAEEVSLTSEDLLDAIAHRLKYPGLTQKPLNEKRESVLDLLAQQPVLLVVDNFESITDTGIADFVVQVPPGVKVLLTSREEEKLLASVFRRYPPARVHLDGLPDAEALIFLRQEAESLADHHQDTKRARVEAVIGADDALLLDLVKATDGNPKALSLALGYIANNAARLKTLIRDLYAAADSVAGLFDYFFHQAWKRCSEDARALWRTTPFFAAPARREALAAAAGLRGRFFYDALAELTGRSLLEVEEGPEEEPRYRAHPLVRAFAGARLQDSSDFEAEVREQWVRWYADFLGENSAEDWFAFAVLGHEQENIMAVITWALATNHAQAPDLVRHFWRFLYVRGHWRQCESNTRKALEQATMQKNTIPRLWLASHLGWILEQKGQTDAALQLLHQIEAEIEALEQHSLLEETDVLNYLGQAYLSQGDLDRTVAYEARHLALAELIDDRHSTLVARYYLARAQFLQEQIEGAVRDYRNLVEVAREINWERAEGYCAYRLAEAIFHLDQLEEAEQWLNRAHEMADHWQEPLLQAHACFGRARLSKAHGQPDKALIMATEALDLYSRLEARLNVSEVTAYLADLDGPFSN